MILIISISALAISDLLFVTTCIPRGIRVTMNSPFSDHTDEYPIIYPVVKFLNVFSYTASIYLTVTLIIERYLTFVKEGKGSGHFKRIKKILAAVILGCFVYNIPLMFEWKWNEDGRVLKTDLLKNKTYKLVYKASMTSFVRFVIPTLCLTIFSINIIRKVIIFFPNFPF